MVFKNLRDKYAVSELFREVATKVGERPGGYTRIIKLGNRQGDNADMCIIELVDYNENLLAEKAAAIKPKSTRRRRGGKKKETGEDTGAVVTADASETEAGVAEEEAHEPEAKTEARAEDADTTEAKAEEAEETGETLEAKPEEDEDKEEKKEE